MEEDWKIPCPRCKVPTEQDGGNMVCPRCHWKGSIGKRFSQPGVGWIQVETYSTEMLDLQPGERSSRDRLLVSRAYVHPDDYLAVKETTRRPEGVARVQKEFLNSLAAAVGF